MFPVSNYCSYPCILKVIVPTIVVGFFQSVKIQEIHANKYKNTFHEQQIDQYIHSHDIFTKKIGSYEEIEFFSSCTTGYTSIEHCFTRLDQEKWKLTIFITNISSDINLIFILPY